LDREMIEKSAQAAVTFWHGMLLVNCMLVCMSRAQPRCGVIEAYYAVPR
jgi:hypothetical protein